MLDGYGRNITYLRISVTDRCNLRCRYCMPAEGIPLLSHADILSFEDIELVARVAVDLGIEKIRLTGGEPLARRGLPRLVQMLGAIPGLKTLAMTTNGTMLEPVAGELAAAGLDSVNISLDTLDPEAYRYITRGGRLDDALAGLRAAAAAGLAVKINMVAFPETGPEEVAAMREFAAREGASLQTISRYSLAETKRDGGEYDRPPPCASCNRVRLLANGVLRSCLHSDIDIPVDFEDIAGSLRAAVMMKPPQGSVSSAETVRQIGG